MSERRIYVLVIMEVNEALFFLFLEALHKEIKKVPVFLSSFRNTRGSLRERSKKRRGK